MCRNHPAQYLLFLVRGLAPSCSGPPPASTLPLSTLQQTIATTHLGPHPAGRDFLRCLDAHLRHAGRTAATAHGFDGVLKPLRATYALRSRRTSAGIRMGGDHTQQNDRLHLSEQHRARACTVQACWELRSPGVSPGHLGGERACEHAGFEPCGGVCVEASGPSGGRLRDEEPKEQANPDREQQLGLRGHQSDGMWGQGACAHVGQALVAPDPGLHLARIKDEPHVTRMHFPAVAHTLPCQLNCTD